MQKLPAFTSSASYGNSIFQQDDLVMIRDINAAVREGKVNEEPPVKGASGRIPPKAFDALCDLFFSHGAISQHNGDDIIKKADYISLLQGITEPFFMKKGEANLVGKHLYDKIMDRNSICQEINFDDARQSLKFDWLNNGTWIL